VCARRVRALELGWVQVGVDSVEDVTWDARGRSSTAVVVTASHALCWNSQIMSRMVDMRRGRVGT
jgi:hypothetical protein